MKIGIFYIPKDPSDDVVTVARHVEGLGFESFWVGEHTVIPESSRHLYPEYMQSIGDPLISLAAAAAATTTIKLGTSVLLVPEWEPLRLAKQIATLDGISAGRLIVGIGAGWNEEQGRLLGSDFAHRWSQIADYVAGMKKLWAETPAEHDGAWMKFPPVLSLPHPVQRPHPPILIGGSASNLRIHRRVVNWGDGWMPVITSEDDHASFKSGMAAIRDLANEIGRNEASIEFTAAGIDGFGRTPESLAWLADTGADRVTLWMPYGDTDMVRRELDAIAAFSTCQESFAASRA